MYEIWIHKCIFNNENNPYFRGKISQQTMRHRHLPKHYQCIRRCLETVVVVI